jgi:hypothetical protein
MCTFKIHNEENVSIVGHWHSWLKVVKVIKQHRLQGEGDKQLGEETSDLHLICV